MHGVGNRYGICEFVFLSLEVCMCVYICHQTRDAFIHYIEVEEAIAKGTKVEDIGDIVTTKKGERTVEP